MEIVFFSQTFPIQDIHLVLNKTFHGNVFPILKLDKKLIIDHWFFLASEFSLSTHKYW
jgi:hypothetical protein